MENKYLLILSSQNTQFMQYFRTLLYDIISNSLRSHFQLIFMMYLAHSRIRGGFNTESNSAELVHS